MLLVSELLIFSTFAFAITIVPGPNMILSSTYGMSHGRSAGFACLLGATVANYIIGTFVALGMAKLLEEIPPLFTIIKFSGALYLFYLAYRAYKDGFHPEINLNVGDKVPILKIFIAGVFNGLSNPKGVIFALAIYSQFWHPERGSIFLQTMEMTTILISFDLVIIGAAILFSSKFRDFLRNSAGFSKLLKYLLPLVYSALALMVIMTHK